jgi:hypothetical protein
MCSLYSVAMTLPSSEIEKIRTAMRSDKAIDSGESL